MFITMPSTSWNPVFLLYDFPFTCRECNNKFGIDFEMTSYDHSIFYCKHCAAPYIVELNKDWKFVVTLRKKTITNLISMVEWST